MKKARPDILYSCSGIQEVKANSIIESQLLPLTINIALGEILLLGLVFSSLKWD